MGSYSLINHPDPDDCTLSTYSVMFVPVNSKTGVIYEQISILGD